MKKTDSFRPASKKLRYFFVFGALFVIIILCLSFIFLPPFIEQKLNTVCIEPPYEVGDSAAQLHKRLFVMDLHADSLLFNRNLLESGRRGHVDIPRMIQGNVALQTFSVVTQVPFSYDVNGDARGDLVTWLGFFQLWPMDALFGKKARALYQARKLHGFVSDSKGRMALITSSDDLRDYMVRRADNPDITACLLSLEGGHALEKGLSDLDEFYKIGFRMISLTHFTDNELGGSSRSTKNTGLTDLGRQVVRRMNDLHMVIDLAHASPRTFDDVLTVTTRPVVVSHCGIRGICENSRYLTDDQILRVAENGGLIGIAVWDQSLGGSEPGFMAKAIRYVVRIAGMDHVALGSDFDGNINALVDAGGWAAVTGALMDEGFTDDDISKIMGGNILDFLKANLP